MGLNEELQYILAAIGDDEPTPQQARLIEELEEILNG